MKITLQKWGARWCGPCQSLEKRQTLQKFAEAHQDVKLEIHDDTESGSKRWESAADARKVKNLPTLLWIAGGEEVLRSEDVSAAGIKEQYRKVLKALGE